MTRSRKDVPGIGGYRLSPSQLRVYESALATGGRWPLTATGLFRVRGRLDRRHLHEAVSGLVARHEILRTRMARDEPLQRCEAAATADLREVDFRGLAEVAAESEIRELVESRSRAPAERSIATVLLLRRRHQDDLLASLPAYASDGAGIELLGGRILEACNGSRRGSEDRGEPQYADVAEGLRRLLESEETADGRDFWSRRISDESLAARLPMEHDPRGGERRRSIVGLVEARLSAGDSGRLEGMARDRGASLEEAVLALWYVFLFRLGGPRRLTVGVEASGRGFEGLEGALGSFARYVPSTLVLEDELAFGDLLVQVRRRIAETRPMSDFFSWETTAEAPVPAGYFPYCFDWKDALGAPRPQGGLRWELRRERTSIDRFHLRLSGRRFASATRGCGLTFWYDARRYDRLSVRALAERFRILVRSATADPGRRIRELEILSPSERHAVLTEWNDAPRPDAWWPGGTSGDGLHELFAIQAERRPAAVAVSCGGRQVSYGELDRRSDRLAQRLRRHRIGLESLVGVDIDRSPETVIAILGILKAGGAYVPLDPAYPRERLEWIVEDTRMPVVVTRDVAAAGDPAAGVPAAGDPAAGDPAQPLAGRVLRIDVDAEEDHVPAERKPRRAPTGVRTAPEAAAYVIHTSGSTGRPKGVVVSHAQASRLFSATRHWFDPDAGDVWTLFHSFAFDFSVWELWGALLHGGRLVVVPRPMSRSPEDFLRLLDEERVSILNQTPSAFRQLIQAVGDGTDVALTSLRAVIFGGEALDPRSLAPWFDRFGSERPKLVNMYGITETTVHVTYRPLSEADLRTPADSVLGVPIPDLQTRLLDRHLQPVPVGVPGEIHVGGAGVSRGYLGRPALTAERFPPDPWSGRPGARGYRSGDLARWRTDRELLYLGRADHQVKIRGYRIELGEIEHRLTGHPAVGEAVVVLRRDGEEPALVAYLSWLPGTRAGIDEIREHLRELLPEQMLPAFFVVLPDLPKTASGKLDRRGLPAPDRSRTALAPEYAGPRTPVEETVAEIFAEILRVERVGLYDSFFDLGGHSLLATRAISRMRGALRVELPVRELFEAPTVAGLAVRAESARRSALGLPPPPPVPRVPRDREQKLPLSFAQQRLWFLAQLEPESTAYNMPLAVRVDGPLRAAALTAALREIVRRHEVLRTTFAAVEGEPVQVIAPRFRQPLPRLDLGALAAPDAWAEVRRIADDDAGRPFDLARGPLLRTVLARLRPDCHVLVANLHHVAGDAWSLEILSREIRELYAAAISGRPSPLPELPVQYADYAIYQRTSLASGLAERQLAYWRARLGDPPPVLELPADRARPPLQSYRGAVVRLALPERLSRQLRALARGQDATLFMCLMALFQLLLSRLGGQSDVAVGTPISGRDRLEVEGLIGFFLNTLVLRVRIVPDASFGELLEDVRAAALAAYDHKDLPFEELVDALDPERSLSHSPIFQVLFVLLHATAETAPSHGLRWSLLPSAAATAKFDLTLSLQASRETLSGSLEYCTDLFDPTTAHRIVRSFETLAAAVVAQDGRPIGELELLGRAERHQLLREWSPVDGGPGAEPVHHLFELRATRSPDALALACGEERLTYAELDRRAHHLAHRLRRLGAAADRAVAVLLDRSAEMAVAVLAVLKAGGAYLPLDPAYPRQRLARMLEDAGRPIVVTSGGLLDLLPGGGAAVGAERLVRLDADREGTPAGQGDGAPPVSIHPDNLAYVIFTSGSTGRPKGIGMPHGTLHNLMDFFRARHPNAASMPQLASFSFDVSFMEMFITWSSGGTLHLERDDLRQDPFALERLVRDRRIERLVLPVTVLQQLAEASLERGRGTAGHLEQVVSTGERLRVTTAVASWFGELGACRLHNDYGPSETHVVTSYPLPREVAAWPAHPPIGRPIPGSRIRLVDRHLQPIPQGCAGELQVGGRSLARGYLGRPGQTAARFVPDPWGEAGDRLYRTGDLARYRPDGLLEYVGRIDHQVKIRGFRVEPGEVESVLGGHPAVREAVVIAPDDAGLVAYLVPEPDRELDAARLRVHLAEKVPSYMVPAAFVVLDSLPLNANGKVDRRALPVPDAASRDAGTKIAPRTPLEEIVAGVWADVLRQPRVSAGDDFFELGGHSLLATRVVARLRRALSVDLPVRDLLEAPTVGALARRLEDLLQGRSHGEVPAILPAGASAEAPLSFAQERLWFIDQLQPGNPTFHLDLAVRLRDRLDAGSLRAALDEIVRRHRALRTTFERGTDGPVQVWAPPDSGVAFSWVDLGGLPPAAREKHGPRILSEASKQPFDLARGPLFRALLARLEAGDYLLLLSMHHVVSDEWSLGVLAREVAVLYAAFAADRPSPLPELPIQYDDFARWQRNWLRDAILDAELAHWRDRLAGAPGLELPTDRPRSAGRPRGDTDHTSALAADLSQLVRSFARRQGATLFMTLLAAFEVFLLRYGGAHDLSVGTPVAGRHQAELEDLIGFFVNLLVLRTDLAGDPGFADVVDRVKATSLDAYSHQELPFQKVVEALRPRRDLQRTPLFQVMFVFRHQQPDIEQAGLEISGASLETVSFERHARSTDVACSAGLRGADQFDLALRVTARPERLLVAWAYDPGLWDPATVSRMARHFETLLRSAVAAPETPVAALPMMSPAEIHQLLQEWNDASWNPPWREPVHRLLSARASEDPRAPALEFVGERLAWGGFVRRANRIAHLLRNRGVGPEDLVGIAAERSLEMMVVVLGVLKSGAAYLPLDVSQPGQRLARILEDAPIAALVAQDHLLEGLPSHGLAESRVLRLTRDRRDVDRQSDRDPGVEVDPDHLACVLFTSGSTGRPKGVAITHGGIAELIHGAGEVFSREDLAGLLSTTLIYYSCSLFEMFATLGLGGGVILAENALDLPDAVGEITLINIVPSAMAELLRHLQLPATVRTVNLQGEAPPAELIRALYRRRHVGTVFNGYGPTEVTTYTNFCRMDRQAAGPLSIGRPASGTSIVVLDAGARPVPIGMTGELFIGGTGVSRGYLKRPGMTAEKFLPDPASRVPGGRRYRTGDLGRFLRDGRIELQGRIDHQVKVRGFRIELPEIEAVLRAHPAVREAVAVVREEDPAGKTLVAYVVAEAEADPAAASAVALRTHVRSRLPEHMVPAAWVDLESIPLLANGKVDRRSLPPPTRRGVADSGKRVAPRDPTEARVAEIWEDVLGCDPVGVTDDFFDLGGHSLMAVRLIERIGRLEGRELPVSTLFEHATVETMAALLRQREAPSGSSLVKLKPGTPDAAPLFLVHGGGGGVFTYAALCRRWQDGRPVYGLQSRGLDGGDFIGDVEGMAAHYLAAIRRAREEGPYLLAGWSMGGVVAYEIARRLHAAKQDVGLLALLDTDAEGCGGHDAEEDDALELLLGFAQDLGLPWERLTVYRQRIEALGSDPEKLIGQLLELARRSRVVPPDLGSERLRHLFELYRVNVRAMRRFRPAPYPGSIILYKAADRPGSGGDPTLGWGDLAAGGVEVHTVPGNHFTLLGETHAAALAERLAAEIEAVSGRPERAAGLASKDPDNVSRTPEGEAV